MMIGWSMAAAAAVLAGMWLVPQPLLSVPLGATELPVVGSLPLLSSVSLQPPRATPKIAASKGPLDRWSILIVLAPRIAYGSDLRQSRNRFAIGSGKVRVWRGS